MGHASGQLTDGGDHLEYVELRGTCPPSALLKLLGAFGEMPNSHSFQLVREGVFVDLSTLHRICVSPD